MCLDYARLLNEERVPEDLARVHTPLNTKEWADMLADHPDRAFARYITAGLSNGFRIGFDRRSPLSSATTNMRSASLHPQVVADYLRKEISLGRMLGPFPPSLSGKLHTNRFRVIPKGHNTGKWRLITDLSFPPGQSVNDGIDPALCSLSYTTVDKAAQIVSELGPRALLAKVDTESAYRLVPVHPCDRHLQAVQWEGQVYKYEKSSLRKNK